MQPQLRRTLAAALTVLVVIVGIEAKSRGQEQALSEYWIGVNLAILDETSLARHKLTSGVGVRSVIADSPASHAGLKKYDLMFRFNGVEVGNAAELGKAVDESQGKEVECVVIRGGHELAIKITPAKRPADHAFYLRPAPLSSAPIGEEPKPAETERRVNGDEPPAPKPSIVRKPPDRETPAEQRDLEAFRRQIRDLSRQVEDLTARAKAATTLERVERQAEQLRREIEELKRQLDRPAKGK